LPPVPSLQEPLEIVDQGQPNHLDEKAEPSVSINLAFEFVTEQHSTQFLAHLLQKFRHPRAFPADDLNPLDVDAVLSVLVEMPAPFGEDISISLPF
jgi:hypothetical protein